LGRVGRVEDMDMRYTRYLLHSSRGKDLARFQSEMLNLLT
jgi:hypothetical protein